MRRLVIACIVVTLAAAGCLDARLPQGNDGREVAGEFEAVRWLAIGDMGTGDDAQARVATAMLSVCQRDGCDFVVGLGDNIYEAGVTSPYDPQFILKFEQPYAGFDIPFFMTLGNHDNAAVRSGHAGGDFQVMYAARADRAMDLWVMPDRWYEHTHGAVRFLALDTNIVFRDSGASGPAAAPILSRDPDGVQQMAWLKATLAAPGNATWTFLHGHHPLFSNGEHGNAQIESPSLQRWLHEAVCESGDIDMLLTGHDHDLQHLPAQEGCGDTEFVVSGAAAQVRDITSEANPTLYSCGSTLGFAWMEVRGSVLTTRFHAADGTLLAQRVFDRDDAAKSSFAEHTRLPTCTPA